MQAQQPREGFVVVEDEGLLATSPTALLMSQQISLVQVREKGLSLGTGLAGWLAGVLADRQQRQHLALELAAPGALR